MPHLRRPDEPGKLRNQIKKTEKPGKRRSFSVVRKGEMNIVIASGKGGTGKTLIATSIASSLDEPLTFLDCDVEEPNAALFIDPEWKSEEVVTIPIPKVDESKCTYCGACARACNYNAIAVFPGKFLLFPELCSGCRLCILVCPEKALGEDKRVIGIIKEGEKKNIAFLQGELKIGEPMATPIIAALKKKIAGGKLTILDAPPGTACPVIETLSAADYAILVTEPTPFGLHDLKLAVGVARKLKLPFGAIINRADIGYPRVKEYLKKEKIPLLLEIPHLLEIARGYSVGKTLLDIDPSYREKFQKIIAGIRGKR
jgi:MinD superfamily P-loop ATPase